MYNSYFFKEKTEIGCEFGFHRKRINMRGVDINIMAEGGRNPNRNAFILLLVIIGIIVGMLGIDLYQRTRAYSIISDLEPPEEVSWDSDYVENEEEYWDAEEIMYDTSSVSALAGLIIIFILSVAMTLLFGARHSCNEKHSRKMTAAFISYGLSIMVFGISLFIWMITWEEIIYGFLPAISICFFSLALFLATYELGGKRYGAIGFGVSIAGAIPLVFLNYQPYSDSAFSELEWYCISLISADAGLIIALLFFTVSIILAMRYTKKHFSQDRSADMMKESEKPDKD